MKQFACGDVVAGCGARFEGESDDEVLARVGRHAQEDHGMDQVPDSLVQQVRAKIRAVG